MKKIGSFTIALAGVGLGLAAAHATDADAAPSPTVILVDKKENELKVAYYKDHKYDVVRTYHTTVGQVIGDKVEEGDLKTPEGIYQFTSRIRPPSIAPKFGSLALYMNYPNAYDRIAGRTGSDIMLHATNEPERLKRDFDSEGCVVVKNEEIEEIQKYVKVGLTPIIIFDELTADYLYPGKDRKLREFFYNWVDAWQGKRLNKYIDHYHSRFTSQGKNKREWKRYKRALNQRYGKIRVKPEKVLFFTHPKYNAVMFVQNYSSTFPSGKVAHRAKGTKTLYVAEEDGRLRIVEERYTPRMWN